MPQPDRSASRPLGLTSMIGVVISSMVGAGLYTTSGFALADLGEPLWVLLAWLMGGLIALCGALGYAVLARQFQESGGEYLYLSRVVHPSVGFLAGIVSLLAGFTGSVAFAATTLESFLRELSSPLSTLPVGSLAAGAVLIATAQHLFRVRIGSAIQNAIVVGKLLILLVFLGFAFSQFPGGWEGMQQSSAVEDGSSVTPVVFATSLMWISLSYCGFNAAIYCAGEVREASWIVPRALLWGTILVTLLYLLMNAVFVYAVSAEKIAGQPQIATIVAAELGGDRFAWLIGLVIVISLYTSVSVSMMIGPRVYARMADDGLFPRWLSFQGETPRIAILLQAGLSLVFIFVATLQQQLTYLSFTLSLCSALTVSSLFFRRRTAGSVPLSRKLAAGFFVVATVLIAFISASRHPTESLAGLATILIGLPVYALIRRWGRG